MTDDEKDIDWTKTCWGMRYSGVPCLKKATWRGPGKPGTFDGKWRACDEHCIGSADVRIEDDD